MLPRTLYAGAAHAHAAAVTAVAGSSTPTVRRLHIPRHWTPRISRTALPRGLPVLLYLCLDEHGALAVAFISRCVRVALRFLSRYRFSTSDPVSFDAHLVHAHTRCLAFCACAFAARHAATQQRHLVRPVGHTARLRMLDAFACRGGCADISLPRFHCRTVATFRCVHILHLPRLPRSCPTTHSPRVAHARGTLRLIAFCVDWLYSFSRVRIYVLWFAVHVEHCRARWHLPVASGPRVLPYVAYTVLVLQHFLYPSYYYTITFTRFTSRFSAFAY